MEITDNRVYVLFYHDTYVDINGSEDAPEVVGVFTSVEEIDKYMSKSWLKCFAPDNGKWVFRNKRDYPHDEIYYYEEYTLNQVED